MPINLVLWGSMDNRKRFLLLLEANNIKQRESAVLIAAVTQRPCKERTVRSWLNDPSKPSSRPCPDWALAALEKAIGYMERALANRAEGAKAAAEPAPD